MCKWLVLAFLSIIGFCAMPAATAQPYFGWSRITNDVLGAVAGPDEGVCIDVPHGSKAAGTAVLMHRCHDGANQRFRLKDLSHGSTRIAVYEGADERCLDFGPRDGFIQVFIEHCANAPRWVVDVLNIQPEGDPYTCLGVAPVFGTLVVSPCVFRDTEKFGHNWGVSQLQRLGNPRPLSSVANLRSCMDVKGGAKSPGASIIHYACGGGANQWFQFHRIDWLESNVAMISVYQGGEQLCMANVTHDRLDAVEAAPCNPSQVNMVWKSVGPIGDGGLQTTFVNAETKRCLTAYADKSQWVGTQPCNGQDNQQWRL